MSDSLKDVFGDFVKELRNDLVGIDQKYSSNENEDCPKLLEKLQIYERRTDELIKHGTQFLGIIEHLKEQLSIAQDMDLASTTSNVSVHDDQAFGDLELLRKCITKRADLESQAMDSLVDLEGIIEALLADKIKLADENQRLRDRTDNNVEIDENLASNVIQQLSQENEELKEIIRRHNETIKLIRHESTPDLSKDEANKLADCEDQLAEMQQQLAAKQQTIYKLTNQIQNAVKATETGPKTSTPFSTDGNDSSGSESEPNRQHRRSQSDASNTTARSSSSSDTHLSDADKDDRDKLRHFQHAYKELTLLLKEKYKQLRKQREEIADLLKQLEKCQGENEELDKLRKLVDDLTDLNEKLTDELKNIKDQKQVEELKKLCDSYKHELENQKEREVLLGRKLSLQETHINTFLNERQNLLKINNDMLNTIKKCKQELAKYNIALD